MASLVESEASLRDQAQIWKYLFGFADSMALKCAVELRIPDILHSHPEPITLAQIAAAIPDAPSPDLSYLFRIMRLLVRRKIFTFQQAPDGSEEGCLYGPTSLSRWLLREPPTPPSDPRRGHHLTLAPMVLQENHPWFLDSWHLLSRTVREGGDCPFEKAYGEMFAFAGKNPEFNRLLNEGMACTARITITTILSHYGDGLFRGGDDDGSLVRSIVDVGGGTGSVVSEIVKAYPHIRGINFDRPHVVKTAPEYPGVTHVGGDMFQEVPPADAVFTKWVLHDWGDELCVKLLKNCRKAIPEKTGKLIIADIVVEAEGTGPFDDTGVVFDLVLLAHNTGGKERTEKEWKKLLAQAGFPRYKITKIPALTSIIEAYPK